MEENKYIHKISTTIKELLATQNHDYFKKPIIQDISIFQFYNP